MDKQELRKNLAKARQYREFAQYAEALALLHQITAEYPEAKYYYYLLAATYYESREAETALQYSDEALKIDPELGGIMTIITYVLHKDSKNNKIIG